MYDLVPTNENATESISWPLTPKSHSLISPFEFTNILEDLTSAKMNSIDKTLMNEKLNNTRQAVWINK